MYIATSIDTFSLLGAIVVQNPILIFSMLYLLFFKFYNMKTFSIFNPSGSSSTQHILEISKVQNLPTYQPTNLPTVRCLSLMFILILGLFSCGKEEVKKQSTVEATLENRTNDCPDENYELSFCLGSSFIPKIITLNNVPGYPSSCTFKVKYEYKWCEVGAVVYEIQALIRNIDILEIDCPEYDQDVANLINTPYIEDYIFTLEEKIRSLIELDFFGIVQPFYNLDCTSSSSWTPVTIKYSQYSCHTYCFNSLPKSRNGFWLKPTRIACENYVCCIVETFMCYDPVLNKVNSYTIKTKERGPEPATCQIPSALPGSCNYFTSKCIDACNN